MNYRRLLFRLRRGLRVPPRIVAFKLKQELQLAWLRKSGGWQAIEEDSVGHWSAGAARRLIEDPSAVFAADAVVALRAALQDGRLDRDAMQRSVARIRARDFSLLGAAVPEGETWPWHTDWRVDHEWQPADFQSYEFYFRDSGRPCDVKYPWELSRLGFAIPLVQNAVIEGELDDARLTLDWIRQWHEANPLGRAVAWFPMEASIRGLNFALIFEMLRVSGLATQVPDADVRRLANLLSIHGEFVERTLEYTNVRGNHYAANIAFLAICGAILKDHYAPAAGWFAKYADAIDREIELQFLPDGVNFEKSVAYHRLVVELFLVASIVMQRAGRPLGELSAAVLQEACVYTHRCRRPDQLSPNVGDNDNARVLQFDPVPLRDHSPLVDLAARHFSDSARFETFGLRASSVWMLGEQALAECSRSSDDTPPAVGLDYFREGGVVTARDAGNFLWMDVGEVGLAGTGGHGHNDLLSFELCLQGQPVIVDPGSYVYTGDPKARDLFRSSRYHNGLIVDGQEIAPLGTMWQISNCAAPQDVSVNEQEGVVTVHASHTGYSRLKSPVAHHREIVFDAKAGTLQCQDTVEVDSTHCIERFLHLDPQVTVEVIDQRAVWLEAANERWRLSCDEGSRIDCEEGWVSSGYGHRERAKVLRIESHLDAPSILSLSILPVAQKTPRVAGPGDRILLEA